MPQPHRSIRRALIALASCLGLVGCSQAPEMPGVLYLSLTSNADQEINADLLRDAGERLQKLESSFRQIHPSISFQFTIYSVETITTALRRRTWSGLGPDLLYLDGETAQTMLEAGLVDPFPAPPKLQKLFDADALMRIRNSKGELAGLPVMRKSQLACFNRDQLPQAPSTTAELLAVSAKKHPVGLSVDLNNLFWTTGSLGALGGLNRAVTGQPLSAAERDGIERWLSWLQNAANQQQITFFANHQSVIAEFQARRLDWIPCDSSILPSLRNKLGAALGVANLPSGVGGAASPLNNLRVVALGRNSSTSGRARALAFSHFSVNPLSQRALTLGSQTVLPANRFVDVPVQSSTVLAAMVQAQKDGRQAETLVRLINAEDPRIAATENLLTELVFGEVNPKAASQSLIKLLKPQP